MFRRHDRAACGGERSGGADRMVAHVARAVRDRRVLDALRAVPRHEFVPAALRGLAYADTALPIGRGQTISQPLIVGLMTEAAELEGGERVLEVGAGSGYQAAVLGRLAREVVTVERVGALREAAVRRLARLGAANVRCLPAGERLGAPAEGPFGAILVAAAAPSVPPGLVAQLADGGRLVLPVGGPGGQELLQLTKRGGRLRRRGLGGCRFVPLIGDEAFPPEAASRAAR